ncbi:hypothetical protein ACJX0J_008460, partial [Zea mays]
MSPPPLLPPQLFRPPKIHQVFRRISANPSPCLSDPAALALDSPCDGSIGVLNGARSQGSVVTPRPAAGSRGSAAGGLGGLSGGSPASAAGVQFSSLQAPSSAVVAAVKPQHMGTYPLKSSSIGKNVSFASPIATVLGGHISLVMGWELQNSVAREGSAASPPTMMEVDGSDKRTNTAAPEPSLLPSE